MTAKHEKTPIRSMTGFSRVAFGGHGVEIDVEVRSVNHRFLDVVVKAPKCYASFERHAKGIFQSLHRRGRVEVTISRRVVPTSPAEAAALPESFDRYVQMYGSACRRYGVSTDSIGAFIGQLVLREAASLTDESLISEGEGEALLRVLGEASEALAVMRESEGEGLLRDIHGRLRRIGEIKDEVSRLSAGAAERARERLLGRVRALAPEVTLDPQRLASEVLLLSDRLDTSEEITRLGLHLEAFQHALKGDKEGVGRKLDFLAQEVGRELNTIGSKAQDAVVQGMIVDAKAELERVREQVQNVE
jgi:uncharacterized protein (TIGR00255 family)